MEGQLQLPRLGNVAHENTTAAILVEGRLRPPLVTVDQERQVHRPISEPCVIRRQHKLCLDDTYHSTPPTPIFNFLLLDWMEKQSSRRRLLEHLESSRAKILMGRPIVCHFFMGRNIQTNRGP